VVKTIVTGRRTDKQSLQFAQIGKVLKSGVCDFGCREMQSSQVFEPGDMSHPVVTN
jgi:hypothetical protein